MLKPKFIALEGIDGSGTSTQLTILKEKLEEQGHKVHITAEPSQLPIGKLIRNILQRNITDNHGQPIEINDNSVALLFAADRLDHIEREILPALKQGKLVISDRFVASSIAYQGCLCGTEWTKTINNKAILPDLILLFTVDPHQAEQRRRTREKAEERFEATPFQIQVAQAYHDIPKFMQHVKIIDADQSIEQVTHDCLKEIKAILTEA